MHFPTFSVFGISWIVTCQVPLYMGILQARILEWVVLPSSSGSPNPGIELQSPVLQMDSLPSEPPGNPKTTGVGIANDIQNTGYCKWTLDTSRLCVGNDNGKTFCWWWCFLISIDNFSISNQQGKQTFTPRREQQQK